MPLGLNITRIRRYPEFDSGRAILELPGVIIAARSAPNVDFEQVAWSGERDCPGLLSPPAHFGSSGLWRR